MHLIHLYTGPHGPTDFEDIPLEMTAGPNGTGVELLSVVQNLSCRCS